MSELKCNKFRPVCLNVEQKKLKIPKEISICGNETTAPIDILDYILKEMKQNKENNNNKDNNKKTNKLNLNAKEPTENCYATDNAWLVVIKNIEKK